jgi:tetratricopeptide (TPR) repeat protein
VNSSIRALKMEAVKYKGFVDYDMNNFPEAERCFKQVAIAMDKEGYIRHAYESCLMLGKIYSREGKTDLAQEYFLKTFLFSDEMVRRKSYYRHDSLRNTISSGAELNFPWPRAVITRIIWAQHGTITQILSDFYMQKGEWQKAYHYQALLAQARDSLNALVRNRDLIELQTKYETSRKEQQIEQLARENQYKESKLDRSRFYMAGLGVMIIMVIIIGILLIRQNKIKTKQRTVILEQKLLRSQMNPHFIFNSMASIQDFIISKDPRSAANYLSRFAGLIRNILDASIDETILVRKEIETIDHYLHLQKVRLEEKFDFVITKNEVFDDDRFRIPSLLIQPFVENAIEHGIRHKPEKGLVKVEFLLRDHWLTIIVEDDGVGRAKAREFEELKRKDHASVSTNLIQERLRILNKKSRCKISLEIRDLYDEAGNAAGTRVEIVVPVGQLDS